MDHYDVLEVAKGRPWLSEDGSSYYTFKDKVYPSEVKARLTRDKWTLYDLMVQKGFQKHAPLITYYRDNVSFPVNGWEATCLEYHGPTLHLERINLPFTYIKLNDLQDLATAVKRVAGKVEEEFVKVILDARNAVAYTNPEGSARELADKKYWGPYIIACPDKPLDIVVALNKEAIDVENFHRVIPTPALSGEQRVMIQTTSDLCRIIVGQRPVLIQEGDNWKVLTILVGQVRHDYYGNTGIAVRK